MEPSKKDLLNQLVKKFTELEGGAVDLDAGQTRQLFAVIRLLLKADPQFKLTLEEYLT